MARNAACGKASAISRALRAATQVGPIFCNSRVSSSISSESRPSSAITGVFAGASAPSGKRQAGVSPGRAAAPAFREIERGEGVDAQEDEIARLGLAEAFHAAGDGEIRVRQSVRSAAPARWPRPWRPVRRAWRPSRYSAASAAPARSVSDSAIRKASSRDWEAFSRGSQAV